MRPLIADLKVNGGESLSGVSHDAADQNAVLQMRFRVDREGSARPRELLQALEIDNLEYEGYFLTRTRVEVE